MSYTDFDFPHTSLYESDLREILAQMKKLEEIVKTFVTVEQVRFADPILWSIATQYSKNTIVLSVSGDAYLSKQPVPAGVQLNNEDYWQEIFNFADYVRTANENLTMNIEQNTTRSEHAYHVYDWLLWNDVLYKVIEEIEADDLLVVDSNVEHFTVEDFCRAWQVYMVNTINQYKDDIDASELAYKNEIDASELAYRDQLAQDITTTTANLQAQLNAAIAGVTVDSEVINARIGWDSTSYATLGDAIRTQIENIENPLSVDEYEIDALKEDLSDIDGKVRINLRYALSFTAGGYLASNKYCCSQILDAGFYNISVGSDYRFAVFAYVDDTTGTLLRSSTQSVTNDQYDDHFIITFFKADNTDFTYDEYIDLLEGLTIEKNNYHKYVNQFDVTRLIELYIIDNSYHPYSINVSANRYRFGIKDAYGNASVIGYDVSHNIYDDCVIPLIDRQNCIIVGYCVLHYTGTDYSTATTGYYTPNAEAYDLDSNPIIKAYLNRTENIVLLGDSLFGYPDYNVLELIMNKITDKRVYNCGFGGCRMAWRTSDGSDPSDVFTLPDIVDAIVANDYSAQEANKGLNNRYPIAIASLKAINWSLPTKVMINYINNDITGNTVIGDKWLYTNVLTDYVRNTFLGAFNYGVQKLLDTYDYVNIIQFTSGYRFINDLPPYEYTNTLGLKASDYNEAIKEDAERIGISIYDFFRNAGRNAYNVSYYQVDRSHYNEKGYQLLANIIKAIDESFIK